MSVVPRYTSGDTLDKSLGGTGVVAPSANPEQDFRDVKPEIVFLPSGNDLHQDHQVLHLEGVRAFKDVTVWGYDLPWNHVTFSAQAFVTLERRHVEAKWEALKCYESQLQLKRAYFSWEFVESLARVRGTQVKADYAEAYEVVRIKW